MRRKIRTFDSQGTASAQDCRLARCPGKANVRIIFSYKVLSQSHFSLKFIKCWIFGIIIQEITQSEHKRLFVIKDESHIKTNNLDELKEHFSKVINISATPKGKPNVELKEIDAINPELSKDIKKAVQKAFDSIQKEFDEL